MSQQDFLKVSFIFVETDLHLQSLSDCKQQLWPLLRKREFIPLCTSPKRYHAKERAYVSYVAQVQARDWAKGLCPPWDQNF